MARYDYIEAVKNAVIKWIDENGGAEEVDYMMREEYGDDYVFALCDLLNDLDEITGGESDAFFKDEESAKSAIGDELPLLGELLDSEIIEFEDLKKGPKHVDVCIRQYVLDQSVYRALSQLGAHLALSQSDGEI